MRYISSPEFPLITERLYPLTSISHLPHPQPSNHHATLCFCASDFVSIWSETGVIYVSNKFPGETAAAGLGTTFWEPPTVGSECREHRIVLGFQGEEEEKMIEVTEIVTTIRWMTPGI